MEDSQNNNSRSEKLLNETSSKKLNTAGKSSIKSKRGDNSASMASEDMRALL